MNPTKLPLAAATIAVILSTQVTTAQEVRQQSFMRYSGVPDTSLPVVESFPRFDPLNGTRVLQAARIRANISWDLCWQFGQGYTRTGSAQVTSAILIGPAGLSGSGSGLPVVFNLPICTAWPPPCVDCLYPRAEVGPIEATDLSLLTGPGDFTVAFTGTATSSASGPPYGPPFVVTFITLTYDYTCGIADIVSIGGQPPGDGLFTGDDFIAFINAFAEADPLADVVSIGGLPPPDDLITGDEFVAFISAFAAGCN